MTAAVAAAGGPIRLGGRILQELRVRLLEHARALAVGGLLVTFAIVVYALVLWAQERFAPPPVSFVTSDIPIAAHIPMILSYALVGAIVAARQPRNPIGWLLLAIGILSSAVPAIDFLVASSSDAFVATPGWIVLLGWLASNFHLPMVGAIVIVVFLRFPDGRPLSRRWARTSWVALGGALLVGFGQALDPSGLRWYPTLPNPTAAPAWFGPIAIAIQVAGLGLVMAGLGLAMWAMALRYRGYSPAERRGLVWIALTVLQLATAGGALLIVRYGIVVPVSAGEVVLTVTLIAATLVPLAAVDGMLRYRLFNIELVLTHALVYVPLTGFLAGLYAASVALFTRVFVAVTGDSSDVVVILSTLVLAGTFTPLRKVLENFVDRHFKPNAPATAAATPGLPSDGRLAGPWPDEDDRNLDTAAELRELQARLARLEQALAERG
jgi:hypothetical protein